MFTIYNTWGEIVGRSTPHHMYGPLYSVRLSECRKRVLGKNVINNALSLHVIAIDDGRTMLYAAPLPEDIPPPWKMEKKDMGEVKKHHTLIRKLIAEDIASLDEVTLRLIRR